MISVYGSTGFLGSNYVNIFSDTIRISRDSNIPESENILYFISTTHNYNIFDRPNLDVNTNLNKLIDVLEEFRKKFPSGTFNFISSWFVYGMGASLNTKETDICDPRGFYSITKRAAEQMLVCYCETYGLKYRILRLTNIIGNGDRNISAKRNAIQYMINLLHKNEQVKLYDGGSNIRDFMNVSDACFAIDIAIRNSPTNQIINISNSQPVSIGEVIEYSKNKLNSKSEIVSIEPPLFHTVVQIKNVCLNNDKILSFGYVPKSNTWMAIDQILENFK